MADLGELIARIGLDTTDLKRGVAESEGLLSGGLGKAAGIAAAAIAAIGVAAVGFGVAAAHKFQDVGGEVLGLMRVAGGTAEEMSKLRFAAQETGVPIDSLGTSIRILSGHLVKNDQAAKDMGIAYRDANGQLLPTNEILLRLADKFASMPNGIEKTRLATELFGRAGTSMIPILNKGRVGLAELEAEAAKFGQVLTTDNINAIRANIIAHREWHAAWEGLQIQLGAVILPLLTKLAQFMTNVLVPGIGLAANFARNVLAPAMSFLFDVIMRVVNAGKAAWDIFIAGFSNPRAADDLTGFGNLFFEFGQRVRVALDIVKREWGLFVDGFRSPNADTTLSGWDGAFFHLGQNVKHVLDGIALAWHSVVSGFSHPNATEPVDGLNTAFFKLGQVIRNVFDWIAAHVEPIISRVSDALANNFSQAVAGGAVALGALAIKAGALDGALGTITSTFEALGAVLGVVSAPVLLVVAGLAALAAAAYYAYQKVQPFHDAMDALGNFLKSTFLAALDAAHKALDDFILGFSNVNLSGAEGKFVKFGDTVQRVFETLGPAVSGALDGIVSYITDSLVPAIGDAFRAIQGPLGDFVRYIREIAPQVQEAVKHIVEVIRREMELVLGVFAAVFVAIKAAWKLWGDDIMRIVRNVFDIIKVYVQTGIRVVRDVINAVLALINGDWGKFWNAISDIPKANLVLVRSVVENGMKIIGDVFVAAWDGIVAAAKFGLGKLVDFFKALPGLILDALKALPALLIRTGNELIAGMLNGIVNAWTTVGRFFAAVPGQVTGYMAGAVGWLVSAGNEIISGLNNGITNAWNTVVRFFQGLPGQVGGFFSSAGSWLVAAGNTIIGGLNTGLTNAWNTVVRFLQGLPGAVTGFFSAAAGWLVAAGNWIIGGLNDGLANAWQTVARFFAGLPGQIGSWVAGAATWLFNTGIDLIVGLLNGMLSAMDRLPGIVKRFTGLDDVIRGLRGAVDSLNGAKIDIVAHAETTDAEAAMQRLKDYFDLFGSGGFGSGPPAQGGTPVPPFAMGGLTHGPSLAGEKGPELVLPLGHLQRARALLQQHGGPILNASGGAGGPSMQSSITNYNLYGPIQAADPAELERQLAARARVASMAGKSS